MFEYQGDCHTSVATLVRNDNVSFGFFDTLRTATGGLGTFQDS
mgnify:FL=1